MSTNFGAVQHLLPNYTASPGKAMWC